VWLVAVLGAVLVGLVVSPHEIYGSLSIVLAATVLLTFIIQLFLPSKEGLVVRTAASIGGSVILLAVATGVLVLLGA
jgi:hypothetical protein